MPPSEPDRRRLIVDAFGIAVSVAGFGFVFGLTAREAGFSAVETIAMSVIAFAGAAQFAAIGYITSGIAWPVIVLLTALLNARHLLYSAAIAPWLRGIPVARRALMAHLLTDEAFALSIAHFRRSGRADERDYWIAAVMSTYVPWNVATVAGFALGGEIPDPTRLGLDVVFPAAMASLAVGLLSGRREIVAALAAIGIGVSVALLVGPAVGIVAGGLLGPLAGFAVPARGVRRAPGAAT